MANAGHFIDRNPTIRTAGLPSVLEMEQQLLKEYSPAELLEHYHQWRCKWHLQNKPQPRSDRVMHYNQIDDVLDASKPKSHFAIFLSKFYEELFSKRSPLGGARKSLSKPPHINNENTLFGVPSDKSSESVYDIIMPKRTFNEVLEEYTKHHDWHIISHNAYYPSEQIRRKYNANFDRNATMGKRLDIDWTGFKVRRAMEMCHNRVPITKVQYDYHSRSRAHVGCQLKPIKYNFPKDKVFGVVTVEDECGADALIENRDPCRQECYDLEAISYVQKLREELHGNKFHDIRLIHYNMKQLDTGKTGILPLSKIFEAVRQENLAINQPLIVHALHFYGLIEPENQDKETEAKENDKEQKKGEENAVEEKKPENPELETKPEAEPEPKNDEPKVNWRKFWQLLNKNYCLPEVTSTRIIPPNMYNKDTIYRDMCKDLTKPLNSPPEKEIHKEDIETAYGCFSPSIPTQYGLDPKDFRIPKSKQDLQSIFSRLISENFDGIWQEALEKFKPKCKLLTVNEMRQAYNEYREAHKAQKDTMFI